MSTHSRIEKTVKTIQRISSEGFDQGTYTVLVDHSAETIKTKEFSIDEISSKLDSLSSQICKSFFYMNEFWGSEPIFFDLVNKGESRKINSLEFFSGQEVINIINSDNYSNEDVCLCSIYEDLPVRIVYTPEDDSWLTTLEAMECLYLRMTANIEYKNDFLGIFPHAIHANFMKLGLSKFKHEINYRKVIKIDGDYKNVIHYSEPHPVSFTDGETGESYFVQFNNVAGNSQGYTELARCQAIRRILLGLHKDKLEYIKTIIGDGEFASKVDITDGETIEIFYNGIMLKISKESNSKKHASKCSLIDVDGEEDDGKWLSVVDPTNESLHRIVQDNSDAGFFMLKYENKNEKNVGVLDEVGEELSRLLNGEQDALLHSSYLKDCFLGFNTSYDENLYSSFGVVQSIFKCAKGLNDVQIVLCIDLEHGGETRIIISYDDSHLYKPDHGGLEILEALKSIEWLEYILTLGGVIKGKILLIPSMGAGKYFESDEFSVNGKSIISDDEIYEVNLIGEELDWDPNLRPIFELIRDQQIRKVCIHLNLNLDNDYLQSFDFEAMPNTIEFKNFDQPFFPEVLMKINHNIKPNDLCLVGSAQQLVSSDNAGFKSINMKPSVLMPNVSKPDAELQELLNRLESIGDFNDCLDRRVELLESNKDSLRITALEAQCNVIKTNLIDTTHGLSKALGSIMDLELKMENAASEFLRKLGKLSARLSRSSLDEDQYEITGWVKTKKQPPKLSDSDANGEVIVYCEDGKCSANWLDVKNDVYKYPYWMSFDCIADPVHLVLSGLPGLCRFCGKQFEIIEELASSSGETAFYFKCRHQDQGFDVTSFYFKTREECLESSRNIEN